MEVGLVSKADGKKIFRSASTTQHEGDPKQKPAILRQSKYLMQAEMKSETDLKLAKRIVIP